MTARLCDSRQPMGTSGVRGVTDVTRRACLGQTGGSTGSVRKPSPIALRRQWALKRLPSAAARSNSTRLTANPGPAARRGSTGR